MEDLSGAREVMKKLNRLGVRLAIDDFGTGHSSLAYLKQFPVHEVKVDRAFVQGVAESQVDSAIVRAVIDLANAMGISAVAEGVETEDQVAELKMLGCPVGQGFYFSSAASRRGVRRASHPPLRSVWATGWLAVGVGNVAHVVEAGQVDRGRSAGLSVVEGELDLVAQRGT